MATIDLDKFRAALLKEDLARSNLFKVEFPQKIGKSISYSNSTSGGRSILGSIVDAVSKEALARFEPLRHLTGFYSPAILRAVGLGDALDKYLQYPYELGMYVKDVAIPGRILNTVDFKSDQVQHGMVISGEYETLNMQFITTPSQKERRFFLSWMDIANDPNTNTFGFYNDYVANIVIKFYNRQGEMSSVTELADCFPVRVGDMELSYENNNQLATFDVSFKFKKCVTREDSDDGDGNIFTDAKYWYDSIKRITKII